MINSSSINRSEWTSFSFSNSTGSNLFASYNNLFVCNVDGLCVSLWDDFFEYIPIIIILCMITIPTTDFIISS